MLLNSYLRNKGLRNNKLSNDIDDLKSIIPMTPLIEISLLSNILIKNERIETKKINFKNVKGEPQLKNNPNPDPDPDNEGGFMELEDNLNEDNLNEDNLNEDNLNEDNLNEDNLNEDKSIGGYDKKDIKNVIVTKFY